MAGLSPRARWIEAGAWLLLAAAAAASVAFTARWWRVEAIDRAIEANGAVALPASADARVRYAAGWQAEHALRHADAVVAYTDAQSAADAALAARAWFALGNAYFQTAIKASRGSSDDSASTQSAELDLARDAYRAALRIDPAMHGARYNLELLERLSPRRPGEGWRRNTDPITIVPNRHNGWTTILETAKRGLP